jgi:hypothetical protein
LENKTVLDQFQFALLRRKGYSVEEIIAATQYQGDWEKYKQVMTQSNNGNGNGGGSVPSSYVPHGGGKTLTFSTLTPASKTRAQRSSNCTQDVLKIVNFVHGSKNPVTFSQIRGLFSVSTSDQYIRDRLTTARKNGEVKCSGWGRAAVWKRARRRQTT